VHDNGSCHDDALVADTLAHHGLDEPVRAMFDRHRIRCPRNVETSAHECDVATFRRHPKPMFMATACIDAIWIHDGLLDARDYKTGGMTYERVADDPRARLQAFVLRRYADKRGLRLRVRYEQLAAEIGEDPESFEPDDED
jgi:hypothetical protein